MWLYLLIWIQPRRRKAAAVMLRIFHLRWVFSFSEPAAFTQSLPFVTVAVADVSVTATHNRTKWFKTGLKLKILFQRNSHMCAFQFLQQNDWTGSAFSPLVRQCLTAFPSVFAPAVRCALSSPLLFSCADSGTCLSYSTGLSSVSECLWFIIKVAV